MSAHLHLVKRLHTEGLAPKAISSLTGLSHGEVFTALGVLGVSKKAMHLPQALNAWEDAVLLGSLLGDGHIRYRHAGRGSPHFSLSHAERQLDFLKWKVEQLGDLYFTPTFHVHEDREAHRSVHATSRCSPLLVPFHEMFYGTRTTKTITDAVLQRVAAHDFRDAVLAVWFGDDGYRSSGNGRSIGYVLGNLENVMYERVAAWFSELGYDGVLHTHRGHQTYRYLLFRVEAAHRFRDAVGPYLHASMQYKLDIGPPRKIRRSRGRLEV